MKGKVQLRAKREKGSSCKEFSVSTAGGGRDRPDITVIRWVYCPADTVINWTDTSARPWIWWINRPVDKAPEETAAPGDPVIKWLKLWEHRVVEVACFGSLVYTVVRIILSH